VPLTIRPITRDVPHAARFSTDMQSAMAEAKKCMEAAQQRMKVYYDKHRRDVTLAVGDQVLLSTKHINLQRAGGGESCRKLMPRYIGPFPVLEVIGKGAYKLELPHTLSRIHNVFNICLLKPFREDTFPGRSKPPLPILADDGRGEMFIIDTLLDHRVRGTNKKLTREYLVKWAGFDSSHNSWEPEHALKLTDFYVDYWKTHGPAPSLAHELQAKQLAKRARDVRTRHGA
jgi:hypothetical protein